MQSKWINMTLAVVALSALLFGVVTVGFAQEKTTITWSMRPSETRMPIYEAWAERFEAQHPNVDVEINVVTDSYYTALTTWFAGGAAPDVMWMGTSFYGLFDVLMPLDDLLEKDPNVAAVHPGAINPLRWKGKLVGLPFGLNTHTVYYNKDRLGAVGLASPSDDWTWDEAMEMAKLLTRDTDGDGTPNQWGFNVYFPNMGYSWGGDVYSEDGRRVLIDRPATRKTMQLFADLRSGVAGVQPPASLGTGGSLTELLNGITAMAHRGVFDVPRFADVPFEWDVVSMPATNVDGELHRSTFYSPEMWSISKDTKHPEIAKEFVRFLFQPEQSNDIAGLGVIPAQVSVAAETFFSIDPPANIRAFVDALDYVTGQYWAHPAYSEVRSALYGETYVAMRDGEIPADVAIPEIVRQANAILSQFDANE